MNAGERWKGLSLISKIVALILGSIYATLVSLCEWQIIGELPRRQSLQDFHSSCCHFGAPPTSAGQGKEEESTITFPFQCFVAFFVNRKREPPQRG